MKITERRALFLLQGCRLQRGGAHQRFIREVGARLEQDGGYTLTPKQSAYLLGLLHRYRRQHGQCDCSLCVQAERDQAAQGTLSL